MQSNGAVENRAVLPLDFPALTAVDSLREDGAAHASAALRLQDAESQLRGMSRRLAEHEEAALEAAKEWEMRLSESLAAERAAMERACASFAQCRETYFAEVEQEVVKLALAIAGRVLQREVAIDPTLLAGVVRVALSKLTEREGTTLRVPTDDLAAWQRAMGPSGLRVEADSTLQLGEIRIEAPAGAVDLGVQAQLVEIERGFFDLMARRPKRDIE